MRRISAFPGQLAALLVILAFVKLEGWPIIIGQLALPTKTFHVTPRETFPIGVTFNDKDQTADQIDEGGYFPFCGTYVSKVTEGYQAK